MIVEGELIEILLVEDNSGDIELTLEAFRDSKFRNKVHTVKDGEAALDFLYRRGDYADAVIPDVVLLDLNLPKKDGKEVLAVIKADPMLKKMPVVILTGSEAEKDIVRSYQLQANCVVTKPMTPHSFMEVVKSIEEFWLGVVKLPTAHHPHESHRPAYAQQRA